MHESNEVDVYSTSSRARVVRGRGKVDVGDRRTEKKKKKNEEQVCDVGCRGSGRTGASV